MHESILMNNYDIFYLMCDEDVDVNMTDDEGRTPLMIACQAGGTQFVKLLLEFEADQNAKDKNGIIHNSIRVNNFHCFSLRVYIF